MHDTATGEDRIEITIGSGYNLKCTSMSQLASSKLALTEVTEYLWDEEKYTSELQAVTGIDYEIMTMPINYR